MFSAFQTFGKLGAIGKAIASASAWSPLALWPDGIDSPGMWISPRTLTSEWQDYLGTTPVATPGTVADSANPVGLALDIRAGAPEVLGPDVVTNGDFAAGSTGWSLETDWSISGGQAHVTNASNIWAIYQAGLTPGKTYLISFTITSVSAGGLTPYCGDNLRDINANTVGTHTAIMVCGSNGFLGVRASSFGTTAAVDNISFREVPGNHMLQSTSSARPLMSAYDGQTLGPGDTYSSTGYPVFQKYDGVDDGMATAAFAAGTLINGMDCMIPVRRDSGANTTLGLNQTYGGTPVFGFCAASVGDVTSFGCGTPTVWVDGAQLTGGTLVTQGTLHDAVTVGEWHIVEYRNLDMSSFTQARFGSAYPGYLFNGARGDILLYPSTASTADKDAARQWLADYYGVTLP